MHTYTLVRVVTYASWVTPSVPPHRPQIIFGKNLCEPCGPSRRSPLQPTKPGPISTSLPANARGVCSATVTSCLVNAASTPMLSWDTTAHLPFTAPEVVPLSHTLIRDRIEPSLESVLKAEEHVGLIPTHVDVAIAPHDPHVAWTAIIRSFRTHRAKLRR